MNLERHISKLLLNYDCVIVPGFGGFVGNYQSASIHPTMHLFMPPSKRIVFNRNLKSNDGLLANELVAAEGLNYNEALKMIDTYVESSEKTLNEGKKLTLDKVGNLFYDIERNLQFEADTSINYLMDSYGLTSVQSFPIKRDTIYAGRELKTDHAMEQVLFHKNNYSRHLWKAAVLVPLVGLGIWFSVSVHVFDKKNISQDSLNPLTTNKVDIFVPKAGTIIEPKAKEIMPEPKTMESVTSVPTLEIIPVVMSNYYIVAGCFRSMENANRFVEELKAKGFNASVNGQTDGGLNRVIYNSYPSKEEAAMALNDIRKQAPNAWLFVKNN